MNGIKSHYYISVAGSDIYMKQVKIGHENRIRLRFEESGKDSIILRRAAWCSKPVILSLVNRLRQDSLELKASLWHSENTAWVFQASQTLSSLLPW